MKDLSVEDITDEETANLTPRARRRMVSRSPQRKHVKAVGIVVRSQEPRDSENASDLKVGLKKELLIGDVEDEDDEVSQKIASRLNTGEATSEEPPGVYIYCA